MCIEEENFNRTVIKIPDSANEMLGGALSLLFCNMLIWKLGVFKSVSTNADVTFPKGDE